MTDDRARNLIAEAMGAAMVSPSGIPGEFYITDREADIRRLCGEILTERGA